jgi:hypothetical protein
MACKATSRDPVRCRPNCVRTHRRRSERGDDGIVLAPVEETPTGSKFTISLFLRRAARHLLISNTEGDLGQAVTNALTAAADAPRCTQQHGARSGWCVDAPEECKSRENIDGRWAQPLWRTSNERGRRSVILLREAVFAVAGIYSLSSHVLQKVGRCHDFAPDVTRARASMSRSREPSS